MESARRKRRVSKLIRLHVGPEDVPMLNVASLTICKMRHQRRPTLTPNTR